MCNNSNAICSMEKKQMRKQTVYYNPDNIKSGGEQYLEHGFVVVEKQGDRTHSVEKRFPSSALWALALL